MSFKYVLFQESGKAKTRREAVRANSLPMLVRSLYVGLHTQKRTGRRMFNLSGGAGVWLEFFDTDLPFARLQKLAPNSFSPLAMYEALLQLETLAGGNLADFPELEAEFASLREEAAKYKAAAQKKKFNSDADLEAVGAL
jgi:hypothetical protein